MKTKNKILSILCIFFLVLVSGFARVAVGQYGEGDAPTDTSVDAGETVPNNYAPGNENTYEAPPEGYNPINPNGAYETPSSNYNPGACPDPNKEYRNNSGNCVPYDESSYGGGSSRGYDPGNTGIDSYGNRPGFDCSSGVCFPSSTSLPNPQGGVLQIIGNVLIWILSIFGFLGLISFIISGIQYILSTGDEKMIDTAKRNMKWSIIGIVVALSGVVIIYAIDKMLRGNMQNF